MAYKSLDPSLQKALHKGLVIPAHPLALDQHRKLDEKRQRLLTRYYIASGADGVAVAVHSTQFEIRQPEIGLLEPVLKIAAEEIDKAAPDRPFIKVAGVIGRTENALKEAELAAKYGYDIALLSNGGMPDLSEKELIARASRVAEILPLFGFYLQPAVGGRLLSYDFWKDFADIPNVYAIKVAAFNRYQTLDVVRAVCNSERRDEIALYTGNDDNIVADLVTPYRIPVNGKIVEKRFVGGLLGHWAVWTSKVVELLKEIKHRLQTDPASIEDLLAKGIAITDMNAVIFDAQHAFHGCIPGIHEVLRRQGLMEGRWCLNPNEEVSPGQLEEIDRICKENADLTDDEFVRQFLERQKAQMVS